MAAALASTAVAAVQIPLTTTSYDVFYHWGIINKLAGHGYATYQSSGNSFYGQLEGHSIPWSGRVYTVQTSLSCNFTPDGGEASEETVNSMQENIPNLSWGAIRNALPTRLSTAQARSMQVSRQWKPSPS